jgi:hypothetical protein
MVLRQLARASRQELLTIGPVRVDSLRRFINSRV